MSDHTSAFARTVENIPIIGHFVSMCHACAKKPAHAERAAIKSSLGICMCICNFPTECVDECARYKSPKLLSHSLTSRPEWMRKYRHYSLRQMSLPGSHQSTSYCIKKKLNGIPMSQGWAKCQELSLSAQLRGGIRFLDVRVMTGKDGEIWTHHNVVMCVTLAEVLDTVRSFVQDHPSEIVGIALDNDGKHIDWGVCSGVVNERLGDRLIREHMKSMLIGDILDQGKNVFIAGIPNVAYSWRGIDCHWPNKQWPEELRLDMEVTLEKQDPAENTKLFWYKAECTPGNHMIGRAVGGVPGAAFAQCADEKFEFVEDLAASVNYIVYNILSDSDDLRFNIISTDFVQDEVVDRIIELNKINLLHDEPLPLSTPNQTLLSSSNEDILRSSTVHIRQPESLRHSLQRQDPPSMSSSVTSSLLDKSVSRASTNRSSSRQAGSLRTSRITSIQNSTTGSVRSSRNTLSHNSTIGSVSGQFEMANRKAPPLEVKETTM